MSRNISHDNKGSVGQKKHSLVGWWVMKLTSPFLSPSPLPILFPSPFSSQWALTLADTVARRPRAEWSPTRASCPWPSLLTTPSPERDSLPTTPSARGPSPQDTKTRVSSWISERSARCGGQSCHLVHFDISGLIENENRVNMSQSVVSTQPSCPWARGSSSSSSKAGLYPLSDLWPLCWRQDKHNENVSFRG